MAEEIQPSGDQQVQVLLDERELKTMYTNAYRIHTTAEEVVIDLGFNMPNPNPQPGQQQLLFKVTDRVVMSYVNAKRLAMSLGQLVKRYEQQFGELPTQPGGTKSLHSVPREGAKTRRNSNATQGTDAQRILPSARLF